MHFLLNTSLCVTRKISRQNLFFIRNLISRRIIEPHARSIMNGSLCTKKFDTPEFQKLFTPELEALVNLFSKNGYELRIAGGAVRDLLTGKIPHDVDFATTATPKEMMDMFARENVRMINNNGEKHGTVTCRINEKENFEVTTLRVDLQTDGRHAEVEFTKDWIKDAERRDLTVNSMFLGCDGTLYDYFGGEKDLEEKRLRFVGVASTRIQEDYLRILRYFRFFGRISHQPEAHEPETLVAIRENAAGLKGISGERIWVELKKIAIGNHVDSIFRVMAHTDVLPNIGFSGNLQFDNLSMVWKRCRDLQPLPMTIITALLSDVKQIEALHRRVKMSNEELQLGQFILDHQHDDIFVNFACKPKDLDQPSSDKFLSSACGESQESKRPKLELVDEGNVEEKTGQNLPPEGEQKIGTMDDGKLLLHHFQDILVDSKDVKKTKKKLLEMLKYMNLRSTYEEFEEWEPPKFPVRGTTLLEIGIRGPHISIVLDKLRNVWKESRFVKTEEELLQHLKDHKPREENNSQTP